MKSDYSASLPPFLKSISSVFICDIFKLQKVKKLLEMGIQKIKFKSIMLIKARTNPNIFNFPRTKIAALLHAPIEILSGSVLLQKNLRGELALSMAA